MASDSQYINASRYDLKAQAHNRRVFHRSLVAYPWRAVAFAIGMTVLAAIPAFNLVDAPRWNVHPWMGWVLGGLAFLVACYFLTCAVLGWRTRTASSPTPSTPH